MIRELATALRGAEVEVDWRDLADMVWLALAAGSSSVPAAGAAAAAAGSPSSPPAPSPYDTAVADAVPAPENLQRAAQVAPAQEVEPDAFLEPRPVDSGTPVSLSLATPARYALPGRLAIGRALRPLKQRRRSPGRMRFDAEATVDRFCDTGVLQPVLAPSWERWFDVALIVDSGPTMALWTQTAHAFGDLLERHGAFRAVSRWTWEDGSSGTRLRSSSGLLHAPQELVDPSGRRLKLVFSDFVGEQWQSRGTWETLHEWGRFSPVALVQALPARLWSTTALGDTEVSVASRRPGQPNQRLSVTGPWWADDGTSDQAMPVVTLDEARLAPWARMVMGATGVTVPGVLGPQPPGDDGGTAAASPEQVVEEFRATASHTANRLATLLSSVELSLPLARVVMEHLVPDARQSHLAELLVCGVARISAEATPEPVLEFAPGVQAVLQQALTESATLDVWQAVVPHLEAAGERPRFAVLLAGPGPARAEGEPVIDVGTLTGSASVAADLIARRALDVTRASRPRSGPRVVPSTRRELPRPFSSPLRVLAVLSYAGQAAGPQLDAVLEGLSPAEATPVDVRLHVLSGDQDLVDEVRSFARPEVTADLVVPTAAGLADQVARLAPHVLHLFGSSTAVAGVPCLAFASRTDVETGSDDGSVVVPVADVAVEAGRAGCWLAVLATGDHDPSPDPGSALVGSGIPAAVVLRHPTAERFDRPLAAMYRAVLSTVRAAVDQAQDDGIVRLDWASAAEAARRADASPFPSGDVVHRRLDVDLTVQSDPPLLVLGDRGAVATHAQIDVLETFLSQSPDLPSEVAADTEARLDQLRAQTRHRESSAETLTAGAWTGTEEAQGVLAPDAGTWGLARPEWATAAARGHEPVSPAALTEWSHPDVGYGVLLPDSDESGLDARGKAAGVDAPSPVRDLLRHRPGTVLLRWRPGRTDLLRRYYGDGSSQDLMIGMSRFGVAKGSLPRYVTIIGTPDQIPWGVQHMLAAQHAVGRLPLSGEALENYLQALVTGWAGAWVDRTALVWAVHHSGGDMTTQVKSLVIDPLAEALRQVLELRFVAGEDATGAALLRGLGQHRPALVVTSSHSASRPLDEPATLRATLGLPIDVRGEDVSLQGLVSSLPPGAVWFAQASYSAGNDSLARYDGLLETGSKLSDIVSSVASLGSFAAPAAHGLLGRPEPVRGVFGYVEPFFDWALRVVPGERGFTDRLVEGVLGIARGAPLGLAFSTYYANVNMLYQRWAMESSRQPDSPEASNDALRVRIAARTRQSLVLLGDPTAVLARLDEASTSAPPGWVS